MLYLQTQKDIPVTASRSSSSEIRKSLFSMGASAASTILLIKLYHTARPILAKLHNYTIVQPSHTATQASP